MTPMDAQRPTLSAEELRSLMEAAKVTRSLVLWNLACTASITAKRLFKRRQSLAQRTKWHWSKATTKDVRTQG